jgi:Snf7
MGSFFSKKKKPEVSRQPEKQKVQVNESELVIAKLKMQIDRMESRVKKLTKDDQALDGKIRAMMQAKKKEEAYFYLKQKKTVKESMNSTNKRLEFVQKQIDTMESAIDDAKFTDILRDSNKAIENLSKEIDMDEIRLAKELQQEGKMRREELEGLLDDDDADDQEIKAEIDKMEEQMLQDGFKDGPQTTPSKVSDRQENRNTDNRQDRQPEAMLN